MKQIIDPLILTVSEYDCTSPYAMAAPVCLSHPANSAECAHAQIASNTNTLHHNSQVSFVQRASCERPQMAHARILIGIAYAPHITHIRYILVHAMCALYFARIMNPPRSWGRNHLNYVWRSTRLVPVFVNVRAACFIRPTNFTFNVANVRY